HHELFEKLFAINQETNQSEFFSVHPFRFLRMDAFRKYKHISDLRKDLENSQEILENISERLDFVSISPKVDTFFEIHKLLRKAIATFIYFDNNVSELLEPDSALFRLLEKDVQTLEKLRSDIE
ncbi:hypothetical protein D0809_27615, partial [Flavobacterium circumlabens]